MVTSEYPTSTAEAGGLGTYTAKTADMLRAAGHSVVVIALADGQPSPHDCSIPVVLVPRSAPFSLLKRLRFFWRYETPMQRRVDSRRLLRALMSVQHRQTIDIVHLASYQSPGLAIASSCKWPTVTRLSNFDWLWREAANEPPDSSTRLLDALERRQACESTRTCCPSVFLAELAQSTAGLTPKVVRTPPPELPPEQGPATIRDPSTIAFVGRCNRVKGFDMFLKTAKSLLETDRSSRFVIAGRVVESSPLGTGLQELLLRFPTNVSYCGHVASSRLSEIYELASCVVVPSRVDNYPNVCLEAQAHGCPVIASRDSSLDEMITDGVDGLFFVNGSATSLKGTLQRFLNLAPHERAEMSRAAIQTDAHRRSDAPLDELVSLYRETKAAFQKSSSMTPS